jgi:hypothetical protein
MKRLWVGLVTAGMFVVRMLTLFLMFVLQHTVGGAQIRPPSATASSRAA